MLRKIKEVSFPEPSGVVINMMPIICGDHDTVPANMRGYLDMIDACSFDKDSTVYLTIRENKLLAGETQSRPGIHTEGTDTLGWGGGSWGGTSPDRGVYLASSDGRCRAWDCTSLDVDHMGALPEPEADSLVLDPSALYWITDRTPHEALPSKVAHYRQFFRLVSEDIGAWWQQHSTPSPFGVAPKSPVVHGNKFS